MAESNAPTTTLPKSKPAKATEKKPARKPPQQIIFRLTQKLHPILQKEMIEWARVNPVYMLTKCDIMWPYKNVNGKDEPLPLDENLDELYIEEDGVRMENPAIRWLPRTVRYVYNLNSPFADEQFAQLGNSLNRDQNGQNEILDNFRNRNAVLFTKRELRMDANNRVLKYYLWLSGQCENIHPKARRYDTPSVYQMLDFGQEDRGRVELGERRKQAYELANSARLDEMIPHAKHLNIPFVIGLTGEEREVDAIRSDYIDKAYNEPEAFLATYADPKIKVMYQISKLIESQQLAINTIVSGQAHWMATKKMITQLPPDRNPVEFLADFSLTRNGEEFANQLQAYKTYSAV